MQRISTRFKKLGLVIALAACTCEAEASSPLLRAVFQRSSNTGSQLSITPSKSNQSYPYAGIKFMNSDYSVLSGCTMNSKNGWCLFPLNGSAAKRLAIQTHASRPNRNMRFQLSLNASGNKPVSVQEHTTSTTPGRIIGYVYGWQDALPAADLAAAGYTHILIAFGLFTDTGGSVSLGDLTGSGYGSDDLLSYIKSLQSYGIKVLLSIGGASTDIPNTTVSLYTAEFGVGTTPNYNPALDHHRNLLLINRTQYQNQTHQSHTYLINSSTRY